MSNDPGMKFTIYNNEHQKKIEQQFITILVGFITFSVFLGFYTHFVFRREPPSRAGAPGCGAGNADLALSGAGSGRQRARGSVEGIQPVSSVRD